MTTKFPSSLFLVFCAAASSAMAQATSSSATVEEGSDSQHKKRSISSEASAALSAGISYQPAPAVPATPALDAEEDESVDLRDVDKPRNEIVRLPQYLVEEQRPAVFSQKNFYSSQYTKSQWMLRRFFGSNTLNQYQFGKAGAMYASQAFWDDERLKGLMEGDRQASIYRMAGDDEAASKATEEMRSSYIRVQDPTSVDLSKWAGQRY